MVAKGLALVRVVALEPERGHEVAFNVVLHVEDAGGHSNIPAGGVVRVGQARDLHCIEKKAVKKVWRRGRRGRRGCRSGRFDYAGRWCESRDLFELNADAVRVGG